VTFDLHRLRREEFPWAEAGEAIYLNVASTGPLPERTIRAQQEFTRLRAAPHRLSHEAQFAVLDRSRALAAELIGANVRNVALAVNTGAGINLAAWGLPLGVGDVVVTPDLEFPANVYPWMAASRARGFELRQLPQPDGVLDDETLLASLEDPRVRVLALSWVGFATGVRADIDRLGASCRERGIWFVVDGIQGVGPLTLDVSRSKIDLLACGGQKWLLSPWGTGFTYVSDEAMERLTPQPVSWMAVRGSDDFSALLDYDLTWRDDARRFEQITLPFQDFAGMAASLALLNELGAASVATHVKEMVSLLASGAEQRDISVVAPPGRRAGIVTVRPSNVQAASERLSNALVTHSVREGTIRLSPHCYSTASEIDSALMALTG
jgi:selenocysteine lyase/cysteine desulfurase